MKDPTSDHSDQLLIISAKCLVPLDGIEEVGREAERVCGEMEPNATPPELTIVRTMLFESVF